MKSEIQKVKRDCRNENRELKRKIYYLENTLKQMSQNQTRGIQKQKRTLAFSSVAHQRMCRRHTPGVRTAAGLPGAGILLFYQAYVTTR